MNNPLLSRNMYVSKQLRVPLHTMAGYVDSQTDAESRTSKPKVKFLTYSTHDWTVAQMLLFLTPDFNTFEVLPYASQVKLELHSSRQCNQAECFWVEAIYNGKLLSFESQCADATHCTYPEFMQMLQ